MTTHTPEPDQTPPGPMTFEESLARLESIVARLEQGDTGLDEAVRAYEEGVVLARRCRERLETAELRIQRLAVRDEDEPIQEEGSASEGDRAVRTDAAGGARPDDDDGPEAAGPDPSPPIPRNEAGGDLFGP